MKNNLDRRHNLIPQNSNWTRLSARFDIGVLDLDNFANLMGFKDFEDLDISITPQSLDKRDSAEFIENLISSSLKAQDMRRMQIIKLIKND